MKKTTLLLTLMMGFLFLLPPAVMAQKRPTAVKVGKGNVLVGYLEGTVRVLPQGSRDWAALKLKDALHGGDEVSIGKNSRLEIVLPDKSSLRFADDTRFKIVQAPEATADDVKVHLAVGRAWANVSKTIGVKRKFEVSCDNAVAGVRGTVYRMNVAEDKSALVRVYDGEVAVSAPTQPLDKAEQGVGKKPTKIAGPKPVAGPHKITMEEWVVLVKAMQQVSIRADGTADKPREFTAQEDRDDWVDWNKQRDEESK